MFDFPASSPFTPDRWLEDGDVVSLGDMRMEVRHCPGHTPGHIIFHEAASKIAIVGDVLFNGTSETPEDLAMGAVVAVDADDLYLNSFCFGLRIHDRGQCDPLFLAYLSRGEPGRTATYALAQGATRYNLSKRRFLAWELALPSLTEQRAIAAVLSDVDALIGSLEALIGKKRAIKRAAMQQLLTGRTRLPGFEGEWETLTLGKLLSVRHGRDHQGLIAMHGPHLVFGSGGLMGRTNRSIFDKPSVLIGRKGTINKPRLVSEPFWVVDTMFYTEIGPRASARFLYYLFCQINWLAYNEASGLPSLNSRTIERIAVSVPSLVEQRAISDALTDMDDELAALERRLNKTRAIKQGMMQQLLTGAVRLPVPDDGLEGESHDA